jgi:hypothetical protein
MVPRSECRLWAITEIPVAQRLATAQRPQLIILDPPLEEGLIEVRARCGGFRSYADPFAEA